MTEIMTAEFVANVKGHLQPHPAQVSWLCDSHEALRADNARLRERAESLAADNNTLSIDALKLRKERDAAEASARQAEQERDRAESILNTLPPVRWTCSACGFWQDRSAGSIDGMHCPNDNAPMRAEALTASQGRLREALEQFQSYRADVVSWATMLRYLRDSLCKGAENIDAALVAIEYDSAALAATPDPPEPTERLPEVAGRMDMSLAEFERRCLVAIEALQRDPNFDSALLALLCDAVRLKREYLDSVTGN